jgi:hypothetical protein
MTEALLDLQSGDGAMCVPPRNNENSLSPMEIGMTTAIDSTVNTPVVASDSSQEESAASSNSVATENVVAQIKTDPPNHVSPVERVPDPPGGSATAPPPDPFDPVRC